MDGWMDACLDILLCSKETICMKYQSIFCGKLEKLFQNVVCIEFKHSNMISKKETYHILAKAQISLYISAVWSELPLSPYRIIGYSVEHNKV